MGQGGVRTLIALCALLGALAVCGSATASTSCASRLLADWTDGRIDRTYAVPCYRQALATLPEDVRVYSSAPDDITRALQARLADRASAAEKVSDEKGEDSGISTVLVVAITSALFAAGLVAAALR
jgi:hypothetical protein